MSLYFQYPGRARKRSSPARSGITLDFTQGLPAGLTFTRATQAWEFNQAGLLVPFSSGQARTPVYDPTTLINLGLRVEEARTNSALRCRDFTNSVWVKTTMSAARDQTGLDGNASTASRLTASGANATVLQAVTAASAQKSFSAYVRRATGSGVVNITIDGGTTWTPISLTGAFQRFSVTQTLANPSIGFQIVTSGDAIIVDYTQLEDGAFPSSPIEVLANTPVTRNAEACSLASVQGITTGATLIVKGRTAPANDAVKIETFASLDDGSGSNRVQPRRTQAGSVEAAVSQSGSSVFLNTISGQSGVVDFSFWTAIAANDIALNVTPGGTLRTNATLGMPLLNRLVIGADNGLSNQINGYINKVQLFTRRLSNADAGSR